MRPLTRAQTERIEERKAKRLAMLAAIKSGKIGQCIPTGYISLLGHTFSPRNQTLLAMQNVPLGIVAGFAQWKQAGRVVKKGEHGADVMLPFQKIKQTTDSATGQTKEDIDIRFGWSSVFHMGQTEIPRIPTA